MVSTISTALRDGIRISSHSHGRWSRCRPGSTGAVKCDAREGSSMSTASTTSSTTSNGHREHTGDLLPASITVEVNGAAIEAKVKTAKSGNLWYESDKQ